MVEDYNLMGPVKAALESVTRYMAAELGPKKIRVHAVSPGPLKTRAASGITRFDELSATRRLVSKAKTGSMPLLTPAMRLIVPVGAMVVTVALRRRLTPAVGKML